jgi:hypothetical protein
MIGRRSVCLWVGAAVVWAGVAGAQARDGSRDFDFEIGRWTTHLSRRLHPLTGSTTWVEYDGTTVVRPVWNGRGNLVELDVTGPAGHIEALSLRLYNPETRQWSLNFANVASGTLGGPTVGGFVGGRGEFYDRESLGGRPIVVRFVIVPVGRDTVRFEQAFSGDDGKTWEVNWVAVDTRVGDSTVRQATGDAWWTGPLLAASANTLPAGHVLVEPYLYDVITPHSNAWGSRTYVIYGLFDRLSVGVIPIFGYGASGVGLGDFTAQAAYRLTSFHVGSWVPTTSVVVQETFPTGRYDELGDRPSDGLGGGAYTTTAAVYTQRYFWMPNGRILRARLDVSDAFSGRVGVDGVSVYGTGSSFRGSASPGNVLLVNPAGEYSVTQHWVLALDLTYSHAGSTAVVGGNGSVPVRSSLGASDAFGVAPAVEYNFNSGIGVIVGSRIIPAGHNTVASVAPVLAINYVR